METIHSNIVYNTVYSSLGYKTIIMDDFVKPSDEHIVHERQPNPNHADIIMYKDSTDHWNYHIRLCCGVIACPRDASQAGVCRQEDVDLVKFYGIAFDIRRCLFYDKTVHIYDIDILSRFSVGDRDKWDEIVHDCWFEFPDNTTSRKNRAREFFAPLRGSFGELILFARKELKN